MRTWANETMFTLPVRRLPANPDLDHLKHQAKDLRMQQAVRDLAAAQRIREFHPYFSKATDAEIFEKPLTLSGAQWAIAREYGFPSWARLKAHIEKPAVSNQLDRPHQERIEDATFRHAVSLLDAGDAKGLRALLQQHPKLVRQRVTFEGGNYFRNPSLLEFVAENPTRHGTLPKNIVDVAALILEAGAERAAVDEALMLVATGRVPRECGVQIPLIHLLCDAGANAAFALHPAALHGEFEAVEALMTHGAALDLPVAAALGRVEEFARLLPEACAEERHLALALAADSGHVEIARMLLDAGVDPDQYNPAGGHSHTTPLHQAAGKGHEAMVRLLIERGARVDIRDVLWHGTPAGWAEHAGRTELAAYLRELEAATVVTEPGHVD